MPIALFCERAGTNADGAVEELRLAPPQPAAGARARRRGGRSVLSPRQITRAALEGRLDLFKEDAMPGAPAAHCERRSNGRNDLLDTEERAALRPACDLRPGVHPTRPPKTSPGRASMPSNRLSRRALSATPTSGSGCWRRSASSLANVFATRATTPRPGTSTPSTIAPSPWKPKQDSLDHARAKRHPSGSSRISDNVRRAVRWSARQGGSRSGSRSWCRSSASGGRTDVQRTFSRSGTGLWSKSAGSADDELRAQALWVGWL